MGVHANKCMVTHICKGWIDIDMRKLARGGRTVDRKGIFGA